MTHMPVSHTLTTRLRRLLRSFRFRLTLWFVAVLALLLAGFSLFIYWRQAQVLRAETTNRFVAQSSQIAAYYSAIYRRDFEEEHNEGVRFRLSQSDLPLLQRQDVLALIDAAGNLIQRSENFQVSDIGQIYNTWKEAGLPAEPVPYTFPGDEHHETGETPDSYLLVNTSINFGRQGQGLLILGGPIDPGGQLPRLALTLALVFVVTLLVSFGGGYWLADQAMRPVQAITHTARDISDHDLSRRLHLNRVDELGELADTFDAMLDRLQAAFERQRQFTADASHELRTPLTIIELESNRILERRRPVEEYEAALRIIQSENEWMSRLVDQLLTLARMDAGLTHLPREPLDLSELAVDAIDRLAPLARQKRVALQTGELTEAITEADRGYLTQMLNNLLENGMKYARAEGARVVVETGRASANGRAQCWLRVADNGPGILPAHLPHLFDRFYRVDDARTRDEETSPETAGSGLGLSIAHSIVTAYGGRIEVASRPDEGTVFTVWMPASS